MATCSPRRSFWRRYHHSRAGASSLRPDQLAAAQSSKRNLEEEAVERLAGQLPQILGDDLRELWLDYSERRSPEAQFAAQIDKLEAALQALEYRDAGQEADVANFLLSAREVVAHPVLLDLLAEIEACGRGLAFGQWSTPTHRKWSRSSRPC
jgi:hypothetical protein